MKRVKSACIFQTLIFQQKAVNERADVSEYFEKQ